MDDSQDDSYSLVGWILGIAVTIAIAVSLLTGIVGALGTGAAPMAGAAGAGATAGGAGSGSTAAAAAAAAVPGVAAMASGAPGGEAGTAAVAAGGQLGAAQPDMSHIALVDAVAGAAVGEAAKLYFETASSEPPADAAAALAPLIAAVKGGQAERLFVSGFHDATGDPQKNAELAKQRAIAVRALLLEGGLTAAQVKLVKPAQTTGDGTDREARRVEVTATRG